MSEAPELIFYRPEEVRDVWPTIRERIVDIAHDCNEAWMPEDVFNDLVAAKAFLWGTDDLTGFLVLQLLEQPYGREMHAWITCNASEAGVADYWPQLKAIAADHGCCRITFENDRRGFQRAIPELRVRYLYSADVT